jgi:D-2-hydroxyglutarate dehydrogenase
MLCGPLAKHKNMVLLSCRSFDDVLVILRKAKTDLSDVIRAVEFMDWESVDLVVRNFGNKYPFNIPYQYFCLLEIQGQGPDLKQEGKKTDRGLERLFEFISVLDTHITVSFN